jgi:hypothetical protein
MANSRRKREMTVTGAVGCSMNSNTKFEDKEKRVAVCHLQRAFNVADGPRYEGQLVVSAAHAYVPRKRVFVRQVEGHICIDILLPNGCKIRGTSARAAEN